jgi:hypothetical protein
MRKTALFMFCFAVLPVFLSAMVIPEAAFGAEKELAVILRVTPPEHIFRCATVERAKEFVVTNLSSKHTITIKASSPQVWAEISPSSQADVPPMGTALFKVEVDCKTVGKITPAKGVVLFEAMNGRQKAFIRVNPPLSPVIPR